MRIGIDISQVAFENTGVANYLSSLVETLLKLDDKNEYVLFYSSLRKRIQNLKFKISDFNSKVKIREYRIPPTALDLLWNKLHIMPIENFIGDVDIFITSDWTEPPTKKAKKVTILYDLIVLQHPEQTDKKIVETQKRKLSWVKKETDKILCISESTARDAHSFLQIPKEKLEVISTGI